jgi:hypothetical protein
MLHRHFNLTDVTYFQSRRRCVEPVEIDGRIVENCMMGTKSRRDDMDFTNNDTPTGLNGCLAKIYNHLTPSGSSKKYFV